MHLLLYGMMPALIAICHPKHTLILSAPTSLAMSSIKSRTVACLAVYQLADSFTETASAGQSTQLLFKQTKTTPWKI